MTSVKPRPPNASGPNGLRGGIKQYVPKTITGRWLEEFGGPSGYRRGFTTVEYETEGQHQQTGARFRPSKEFGPELPDEFTTKPPSSPFKYETANSSSSEMWMTTTREQGMSILKRDKVSDSFRIETAFDLSLKLYISLLCSEKGRRNCAEASLGSRNFGELPKNLVLRS